MSTAPWGRLSVRPCYSACFSVIFWICNLLPISIYQPFTPRGLAPSFVLMARLFYLDRNAKASQYWCILDYIDTISIWKLLKRALHELNMLSNAKQQQSQPSCLLISLFSKLLLSTSEVPQTLSCECKSLAKFKSLENSVTGNNRADKRMQGSEVLKKTAWRWKGRQIHMSLHWQVLLQEITPWRLEGGLN